MLVYISLPKGLKIHGKNKYTQASPSEMVSTHCAKTFLMDAYGYFSRKQNCHSNLANYSNMSSFFFYNNLMVRKTSLIIIIVHLQCNQF